MRLALVTFVPHDADTRTVNDLLEESLAPYLFDNEDMWEDEDWTEDAMVEFEACGDKGGTWQDYARDCMGLKVTHDDDGDHAWMQSNPEGFIDYWYDYTPDAGMQFTPTGTNRISVPDLARLMHDGYEVGRSNDAESLVDDGFVIDGDPAQVDEVLRTFVTDDASRGLDAILVGYHV